MITMYNWNEIGERIRFERKKKNMSMDALAESIGTSRQTIARWERGEGVEVTLNMLLRLYDVTEGAIYLDGTDLRDIEPERIRERIAAVPQKAVRRSTGHGRSPHP